MVQRNSPTCSDPIERTTMKKEEGLSTKKHKVPNMHAVFTLYDDIISYIWNIWTFATLSSCKGQLIEHYF
jgi:hypothetical protein